MASSARHPSLINLPAHHTEQVHLLAQRDAVELGIDEIANSWQRSITRYGIDPESKEAPRILTSGELTLLREPLDRLIFSAQEEIDRLYKVVREAGYTILFCDTAGVAVEHRGDDADAVHGSRFYFRAAFRQARAPAPRIM